MSATILHINEIVSDPIIRGGRPVIKGTGLKVSDVWLTHTTGDKLSAEVIAQHFGLELGQVYAALAYYHLHKDEIDREIRTDAEDAERLLNELESQGKLTRFDSSQNPTP
jgi:uncharacterized protein (DUF433 family)